jgi:hypothetical protein
VDAREGALGPFFSTRGIKIAQSGEAKGPAEAGPFVDLLLLLALGMSLITVLIGGL